VPALHLFPSFDLPSMTSHDDLLSGDRIYDTDANYSCTIVSLLNEGFYAKVYLVSCGGSDRKLALKAISVPVHQKSVLKTCSSVGIHDEHAIQTQCRHQRIVECVHGFATEATYFLYLELLHAGDASHYLLQIGSMQHEFICIFHIHVLNALQYIHMKGFAHRDVKLENILLSLKNGCPHSFKLGDFGLAKLSSAYSGCKTLCGTLDYMAPEVVVIDPARRDYGQQVDVWGFGISMHMLSSGEHPYGEGDLFLQVQSAGVVLSPKLKSDVAAVLQKVLVQDPRKRARASDLLQSCMLRSFLATSS